MEGTLLNAEQVADKLVEESWLTREFGSVALSQSLSLSLIFLRYYLEYPIVYLMIHSYRQRNGAMEGGRLGGTDTRIIGDFDMEGEIFGRDI